MTETLTFVVTVAYDRAKLHKSEREDPRPGFENRLHDSLLHTEGVERVTVAQAIEHENEHGETRFEAAMRSVVLTPVLFPPLPTADALAAIANNFPLTEGSE